MFGLTDDEKLLLENLVIQPLKKQGCRVWIFGSRATGQHQKFSDIDILFEKPLNQSLPPGFLSTIIENAENSRLNYKVDLVDNENLAESYRPSVMASRREI